MKISTVSVLKILKLLALLASIGYAVEAGSIIISVVVSKFNPEAAKNIYKGLDLYKLKEYSNSLYYQTASFIAAIAILKSTVWLMVTRMLSGLNIRNPFKPAMTKILEKISYTLVTIWIIGFIANIQTRWIEKRTGYQPVQIISIDEFLFLAGLVYIISQVFKRGIEIQSENDLTI